MAHVQIIAVTTADVGPLGPEKRLYAVNLGTADEALDVVRKRLKPQERAV